MRWIMALLLVSQAYACWAWYQARKAYAAISDYGDVRELEKRIASLERDRDANRRQEEASGEHYSWPFQVPDNVQPRVVDYSEETST